MKARQRALIVAALAAVIGCKDKTTTAAGDKLADKPAEPGADKAVEAAADKPAPPVADKAADPAAAPAVGDKPAGADGWTTYTSKEGKYTIEFPTAPKERGMLVTSEFGATDADSRTSACGIAVTPVPGKDASPKGMLDAMASGYKTDAKILEEKDIKIGTHPGRSLVIESSSHRKWFRLYVINDKLVINNCGGPFDRGDKDAPVAKRVLDSFKPQI